MRPAAHLLVYLLFLLLAGLYTWPLVSDPAHLLPPNGDPRLFSWVLITIFDNLTSRPALLFHGNAFYPFGNTLSLAEPLLVPALVAGPLHAWSGSPILAYNLTLLLLWAASGWAMYWVAYRITARHPAAFVAAVVFTFAPYRMDHYMEFQMEMAFGIPLAIYALVRFLETRRARYLAGLVAAFWLQAASVWYYAIILAIGLVVVAVQVLALRWAGWRPRTVLAAAAAGAVLLLALVPLATPYFLTRQELGLERSLTDAIPRSANLLSFVEARANWLYEGFTVKRRWEASLFLGLAALGFVLPGLAWLRRAGGTARGPAARILAAAAGALLAALLATAALGGRLRVGGVTLAPFTELGVALVAVLGALQALEGWRRWRAGAGDRRLTERDWTLVCLGLAGVAFLLSLGPVVALRPFGQEPLDEGLYGWLWPHVFLFRAIRGPTRIGILLIFAGALLAGLGAQRLLRAPRGAWRPALVGGLAHRAPRAAWRPVLVGGLALALLLEYAWMPLPYRAEPAAARPVDDVIRTDGADVAVLEWPPNVEIVDADAMFRSLAHGKRVVNGLSGFVPTMLRDLSGLLSAPDAPFPPEAQAALRRIYPLRYLVVRLDDHAFARRWQPTWHRLRRAPPPGLRHRGTFGDADLYEIHPQPERGLVLERWVSYDFLLGRPLLEASVRPLGSPPGTAPWVEVALNGRPLARLPLEGLRPVRLALRPPFRRVAPNMIRLTYGYERVRPADPPAWIGTTGVASPADLVVASGGQPHGDLASIRVNAVERARGRRGYNLVALDPAGRLLGAEVFDTFLAPGAPARLAAWIAALPAGAVVAGAVKDEASALLDEPAVRALRSLGLAGDLRGRFRDSHAFVGVKGAAPGTALERLGPRRIELTVGHGGPDPRAADSGLGLELTGFALRAAADGS